MAGRVSRSAGTSVKRSRPVAEPDDEVRDPDDEDQGDEDQGDEPERANASTKSAAPPPPAVVENGAGFVLGLLFWGWVAMPFLKGGPSEVKKVFMAKFLNRAPDGSWLP